MIASENGYKLWLIERRYSEFTPSGNPSTIYEYCNAIKNIMKMENIDTWSELPQHINRLVLEYGEGGINEDFGKKKHSTPISALLRFKDYLIDNNIYTPKRILNVATKIEIKDTIKEIPEIKISTKF